MHIAVSVSIQIHSVHKQYTSIPEPNSEAFNLCLSASLCAEKLNGKKGGADSGFASGKLDKLTEMKLFKCIVFSVTIWFCSTSKTKEKELETKLKLPPL